jgi:2-iminobutanoate/2-iminopropanoate deaminase
MNEEWVNWFPAEQPARQGARLPLTGFKISIALIAEA